MPSYPKTIHGFVRKHDPCKEASEWLNTQPDMAAAWDTCQRSDWMLWTLEHIGYSADRELRLFACWCARQVWHLLMDERSRMAVEVAERFANGQATEQELSAAKGAAMSAALSAASSAALSAAWIAVEAAWSTQADELRLRIPNPWRTTTKQSAA